MSGIDKWEYCVVRPFADRTKGNLTARVIPFNLNAQQLATYEYQQFRSLPQEHISTFLAIFWSTISNLGEQGWELVHYRSNVEEYADGNAIYSVDLEAVLKRKKIAQGERGQ